MFKVWLAWAKIDPLVISFGDKILGFLKQSWGHILELYAKAKSSLIHQQVQLFNKKSKKNLQLYGPLVWLGFNW